MQSYTESILHSKGGGPAIGVSVRVVTRGTNNLAVLYADNGVTTMANPTVTDELGTFKFYAANGRYDIILSGAALKKPAIISDVVLYDASDEVIVPNPTYAKETDDHFLSGRQRDLTQFNFAMLYGNGQQITAANVRSGAVDVSTILSRVNDKAAFGASGGLTSAVPDDDMCAWKFSILPSHLVTVNRPRAIAYGKPLKFHTHYRMYLSFRLNHPSGNGWTDKLTTGIKQFQGSIFSLAQAGDVSGDNVFSPGQLNGASSPLYFNLDGAMLYPELHTLVEGLGVTSTDPDATTTYTKWGDADTRRVHFRGGTPGRMLAGLSYNEIVLDFFLDEKRIRDGGRGYFKATFNGEFWFHVEGATSHPRNANGRYIDIIPRLGPYEVTGSTTATGQPCSTVPSCIVERAILVREFSCLEAKKWQS